MVDATGSVVNDGPATSGWQAESWRLTSFVTPGTLVSEPNWWSELVGEPPDVRTSNPKQGVLREQGTYQGGTLVLGVQFNRIDWILAPQVSDGDAVGERPPSLGSLSQSMGIFGPLARRWLELSPPTSRLALGAVLFQPAEHPQEAYRLLGAYVPSLRLDSEGCSDLLYQINRPRMSAVHNGLRINRLMKWSAASYRLTRLAIAPEPQQFSQIELYLVARVELDINTAVEFGSGLPSAELPQIFDEMARMGFEIAQRGDTP